MRYYLVLNLSQFAGPLSLPQGISIPSKDRPGVAYSDLESATRAATELASKNPGAQYAVMAPSQIFEAQVPKIIEKIFNDQGELVVRPTEE